MFAPTTIYPGSDLKSGLLSIHQSIGEDIELRLDALRTERDQKRFSGRVDRYLSYYPSTTTSMISPSVEFSLPRDWSLTIGGSHGKDRKSVVWGKSVSVRVDQGGSLSIKKKKQK